MLHSHNAVLTAEVDHLRHRVEELQGDVDRANGRVSSLTAEVEKCRAVEQRALLAAAQTERRLMEVEAEAARLRSGISSATEDSEHSHARLGELRREVEELQVGLTIPLHCPAEPMLHTSYHRHFGSLFGT